MSPTQSDYWNKLNSVPLTSIVSEEQVRLSDLRGKVLAVALLDQTGANAFDQLQETEYADLLMEPDLAVAVVVCLTDLSPVMLPLALGLLRAVLRDMMVSIKNRYLEEGKAPPADLEQRFLILLPPQDDADFEPPKEGLTYMWVVSPSGEVLESYSGSFGLTEAINRLRAVLAEYKGG
jgi:hypothetical protein